MAASDPTNRKDLRLLLTPRGGLFLAELDETMVALRLEMAREISREALESATALLNDLSARLRRCDALMRGR